MVVEWWEIKGKIAGGGKKGGHCDNTTHGKTGRPRKNKLKRI